MKAELKFISSPDILDIENYIPNDKENFGILLQLFVGPIDKDGEESFDFMLCTPKWLISNYNPNDIIFGRHYLIVFEYNYHRIYERLKNYIDNINGITWDDIAMKIGRIGKWEFEDYIEYKGDE